MNINKALKVVTILVFLGCISLFVAFKAGAFDSNSKMSTRPYTVLVQDTQKGTSSKKPAPVFYDEGKETRKMMLSSSKSIVLSNQEKNLNLFDSAFTAGLLGDSLPSK